MADQHLPGPEASDLLDGREGDLDDDVGAPGVVGGADRGPGVRVLTVRMPGTLTGAGLHSDLEVIAGERLHDVRDQRHTALTLPGLLGDTHPHRRRESLLNGGVLDLTRMTGRLLGQNSQAPHEIRAGSWRHATESAAHRLEHPAKPSANCFLVFFGDGDDGPAAIPLILSARQDAGPTQLAHKEARGREAQADPFGELAHAQPAVKRHGEEHGGMSRPEPLALGGLLQLLAGRPLRRLLACTTSAISVASSTASSSRDLVGSLPLPFVVVIAVL